jgi:hypothetical protein
MLLYNNLDVIDNREVLKLCRSSTIERCSLSDQRP